MGRQRKAVTVNQFAGGFNTEANPLSFPEGASFDEQNVDFISNGSRRRRNGFDVEFGTPVSTGVIFPSGDLLGRNQYLWEDAGGLPGTEFLVVQIGNYIGLHSTESAPLSSNLVYSTTFPQASPSQRYGIASVSGRLVIADGTSNVWTIEYDGTNFTRSSSRLLIRDLFGVQAGQLTEPQGIQTRPTNLADSHLYNLRNQTFALPRPNGSEGSNYGDDPLRGLRNASSQWPSNGDNVNLFLLADANFVSNRTVERFNAASMRDTPPYNTRAPMGYFIIDALDRGQSRETEFRRLTDRHSELQWRRNVSLPQDRTAGGASITAEYAGRVWYAGFKGEVIGSDNKSPNLSSYILFSQVVKEGNQIYWCYQSADPTSHIDADLVDTDGGFIKIDSAVDIVHMVNVASSLFLFASNGVWSISGIDGNSFTATGFSVRRLSDKGCVSAGSVVLVDDTVLYWSESGIHSVARDRYGEWIVSDLTEETIRTFYQEIPLIQKQTCSGYYDVGTNTIRWVYGDDLEVRSSVTELVLSKKFQAFSKNIISTPPGVYGPITVSGGNLGGTTQLPVTVLGEVVTADNQVVTSASNYENLSASQNFYCVITSLYPTLQYKFGGYSNASSPYDWTSLTPTDSPAFLTTGFMTAGEARLTKDIPYITAYFNRTEVEEPVVQSSCFLQTRWDWTTTPLGGRWTAPRQIYRTAGIRTGDDVVKSRNKIRGMGKSAAVHFESEPGKFFHLFGWEHNLEATTDE